jgi:hypothetical protein
MMSDALYLALANAFCSTPLPTSVCSDLCATDPYYPYPRHGTNLMSVAEAEEMLRAVLAGYTITPITPLVDDAPQTYGERAVGLSFNLRNDSAVDRTKRLYAQIIDEMDAARRQADHPSEKARLASVAITEAQGSQIWAVKALTWRD